MEKAIKIIEDMQQNSAEAVVAMEGNKMRTGYTDYTAGWDDALAEAKKLLGAQK